MGLLRRNRKTPEDEFAAEVAALVAQVAGVKATIGADFSLSVPRPGSKPATMFLQNIYAEADRLEGQARTDMLVRAARGITSPQVRPTTWTVAAPALRPAVRAVSWAAAGSSAGVVRRALVPFVQAMVAIDFPDSMTYVTDADLTAWEVDHAKVEQTAAANLKDRFEAIAKAGPVGIMLGPDGYTSSWLAVPAALLEILDGGFGPAPVAIAVSRDQLRIVDSTEDDVVTAQLAEAIDTYPKEPRQLSPVAYLIREPGIEPWVPHPSHPAAALAGHAAGLLALHEYERQKHVLQDLLTKTGEDVFVGGYQLVARQDRSVWSWSVWPPDVTNALIPRTDYIILSDPDDRSAKIIVAWDDVISTVGDGLTLEPGYEPPRWHYRRSPTRSELDELKTKTIQPGN
jgi:hypothetical protein